jgi:thioredoxin reductase
MCLSLCANIAASFHNLFAQGYYADPVTGHAGVLGMDWIAMPEFALHLSHLSNQLVGEVTIYTNGNTDLAAQLEPSLVNKPWKMDIRKIKKVALKTPGQPPVVMTFEDNTTVTEDFIGHAPISKLNGADFAQQLGLEINQTGDYTVFGPFQMTSAKGVYAAGDTMSMFKVLPNAVASGAQAAAGVAVALQEEKWGLPSIFG